MPLFRFQRRTLSESLATTIIVNNVDELLEKLAQYWEERGITTRDLMYQWQCAVDKEQAFDLRCGWYTHRVVFQVRNSDPMVCGFLSEPFQDDRWAAQKFHNETNVK